MHVTNAPSSVAHSFTIFLQRCGGALETSLSSHSSTVVAGIFVFVFGFAKIDSYPYLKVDILYAPRIIQSCRLYCMTSIRRAAGCMDLVPLEAARLRLRRMWVGQREVLLVDFCCLSQTWSRRTGLMSECVPPFRAKDWMSRRGNVEFAHSSTTAEGSRMEGWDKARPTAGQPKCSNMTSGTHIRYSSLCNFLQLSLLPSNSALLPSTFFPPCNDDFRELRAKCIV